MFGFYLMEGDGVLVPPVLKGCDDLLAVSADVARRGGRRRRFWPIGGRGRVPASAVSSARALPSLVTNSCSMAFCCFLAPASSFLRAANSADESTSSSADSPSSSLVARSCRCLDLGVQFRSSGLDRADLVEVGRQQFGPAGGRAGCLDRLVFQRGRDRRDPAVDDGGEAAGGEGAQVELDVPHQLAMTPATWKRSSRPTGGVRR